MFNFPLLSIIFIIITLSFSPGTVLNVTSKLFRVPFNGTVNSSLSAENALLRLSAVSTDTTPRWPKGVIPYRLDASLYFMRCQIRAAMLSINLASCVHFRPDKPSDGHYVTLTMKGDGCSSPVGYSSYSQSDRTSSLDLGCFEHGTLLHELMHVLGFYHEQSRSDRDTFLNISYTNILDNDFEGNFMRNAPEGELTFGLPFDFDSVMLYGSHDFAINRSLPTMQSKIKGKVIPRNGSKDGLSKGDIHGINRLYNCSRRKKANPACSKLLEALDLIKSCPKEAKEHLNVALVRQVLTQCKSLA